MVPARRERARPRGAGRTAGPLSWIAALLVVAGMVLFVAICAGWRSGVFRFWPSLLLFGIASALNGLALLRGAMMRADRSRPGRRLGTRSSILAIVGGIGMVLSAIVQALPN